MKKAIIELNPPIVANRIEDKFNIEVIYILFILETKLFTCLLNIKKSDIKNPREAIIPKDEK